MNLQDRILHAKPEDFNDLAIEVFLYQSRSCPVYREYLTRLKKLDFLPASIEEIPFLPMEIFKHQVIKSGDWKEEKIFESSGTTMIQKSKHYIKSLEWYNLVSQRCFEFHYGPLTNYNFLGLLPGIDKTPNSSLLHMFHYFSNQSNRFYDQATYFENDEALCKALLTDRKDQSRIILFGLSFALLDFAAKFIIETPDLIVIETGGMKSKHREMDKHSLHLELRKGFPNAKIHSEYGMTEMMSQAYAYDGLHFSSSPCLKFFIADPTDPLEMLKLGSRGLINVVDLGNLHTCSFLQTGDLGILDTEHQLEILGRFNPMDMRGCVQLYE